MRNIPTPCSIAPVVMIAIATIWLGGCAGSAGPIVENERYPQHLRQTQTLDVQVFREGPKIWMTNTSARSFGPVRMWVNEWYSRVLEDGFAIGQTLEMSLYDFEDVYGDSFRGGGFFATERPEKLVLAQLETEDGLLGLVVVNEDEE